MFTFRQDSDHTYTLNDSGDPVQCRDAAAWGRWMETHDRRISHTRIGPFDVLTEFTGENLDLESDPPVLWQTTVKPPLPESAVMVYGTRADAETGHRRVVEMAKRAAGTAAEPIEVETSKVESENK